MIFLRLGLHKLHQLKFDEGDHNIREVHQEFKGE